MNITVTAEAPVHATEDETKVERALRNIFPAGQMERVNVGEDVVRLRIGGNGLEFLSKLRSLIKQERIRSAARSIILRGTRENKIHLWLDKKAAFVSRVSFCEPVGLTPVAPPAR